MTSRPYYYFAQRCAGKVIRHYVGRKADPVVKILSREDRLRKAQKLSNQEQQKVEQNWYSGVEALVVERQQLLMKARNLWLMTQGFRVTGKKPWAPTKIRKLGGRKVPKNMTRDDFDTLVKLSEFGDANAIGSLRTLLQDDRETWRPFGDLAQHVESLFKDMLTRGDVVARTALEATIDELRIQLRGDTNSVIRGLVIDQIVMSWIDLNYLLLLKSEPTQKVEDARRIEQRVDRVRKRYREDLELLVRVDGHLGSHG